MTITIDDPDLVARLLAAAAARGEDPNRYAIAAIADALNADEDPDDLSEEAIAEIRAGIRRGLADCEAGRVKPVAQWAAQLRRDFDLPTHLTDEELAR